MVKLNTRMIVKILPFVKIPVKGPKDKYDQFENLRDYHRDCSLYHVVPVY
jgi:hypothetical protein